MNKDVALYPLAFCRVFLRGFGYDLILYVSMYKIPSESQLIGVYMHKLSSQLTCIVEMRVPKIAHVVMNF